MSSNETPTKSGSVSHAENSRLGVISAIGAYGIWGLFPLMFRLLDGISPVLIVAHRVIWSLIFVGGILKVQGRLGEVKTALGDKKVVLIISLSAALLSANWLLFIWAIEAERVLEVSLGYFINPLVNVLLGMVFLREKQNRLQWIAIIIAVFAMGLQTIGLGAPPLISLALAFSFGAYGFLRKIVSVGSAPGLFIETLMMLPFALAYLTFVFVTDGPGVHLDPKLMSYLIFTGPITAGALLFFATAARNLRLTTLGMFQYIAPTGHFITAVWLFHEPLNSIQV